MFVRWRLDSLYLFMFGVVGLTFAVGIGIMLLVVLFICGCCYLVIAVVVSLIVF